MKRIVTQPIVIATLCLYFRDWMKIDSSDNHTALDGIGMDGTSVEGGDGVISPPTLAILHRSLVFVMMNIWQSQSWINAERLTLSRQLHAVHGSAINSVIGIAHHLVMQWGSLDFIIVQGDVEWRFTHNGVWTMSLSRQWMERVEEWYILLPPHFDNTWMVFRSIERRT